MKKHFTATAYIVSKIDGELRVLLHKHTKLNIWIAIGGHLEKAENPYQAVLREVKEETHLDVEIVSEKLLKTDFVEEFASPVAILEEFVPKHQKTPAHIHIDCIYFAFCKKPEAIKMKEEYKWFSKRDLKTSNLVKEVNYFMNKLFKLKVLKSI